MKKFTIAIIVLTIMSCTYIKNYDIPCLNLSGNGPYQLNITDFPWGYGVVTMGQFNGDFDKLDEKVYNLLKGKTGSCRVNLQATGTDKYGKADGTLNYIGDINIDELNKFQDWKYWQKDAGIRTLLYKRFIQSTDSLKVEPITTVTAPQRSDTTLPMPINIQVSNVAMFGLDDLYHTQEKPATLANNRWVINGTIGEVYYELGQMQVITSDGNVLIKFYPSYMTASTSERFKTALETGNVIKCVGTRTDSTTYDLLAAKVTNLSPMSSR